MDILCKFIKQVGPNKQVGQGKKATNDITLGCQINKSTRLAFLDFFPTLFALFPPYLFIWHPRVSIIQTLQLIKQTFVAFSEKLNFKKEQIFV